jgi:hypothetical protein
MHLIVFLINHPHNAVTLRWEEPQAISRHWSQLKMNERHAVALNMSSSWVLRLQANEALEGTYKRPSSDEKPDLATEIFQLFLRLLGDKESKTYTIEPVRQSSASILCGLKTLQSGIVYRRR